MEINRRNYTRAENDFLHRYAGALNTRQLAEVLGRTERAISQWMNRNVVSARVVWELPKYGNAGDEVIYDLYSRGVKFVTIAKWLKLSTKSVQDRGAAMGLKSLFRGPRAQSAEDGCDPEQDARVTRGLWGLALGLSVKTMSDRTGLTEEELSREFNRNC